MLVAVPPLVLGHLPGDDATRLERLLLGYALAGLPYLWVLRSWRALPASPWAVLAVVASTRVALLSLPPLLSEDLWRYVWDGALHWVGVHPYAHAPADPALDGLWPEVRARIGHPEIPTIYPPAAQIVFAAGTVGGASVLPLRMLFVAAEGATVLGLWSWARRTGRDPRCAALYGFAPLAMIESAVGAHVDAVGVAALVGAGVALSAARPTLGGFALAIAAGTKLFPLAALPALWRRAPRAVLAALAGVLLIGLPYALTGPALPGGLATFAHRWRANDGAFAWIAWPFEQAVADVTPPMALPRWVERGVEMLVGAGGRPGVDIWPDELAFAGAKATALLVLLVFAAARLRRSNDLEGFLGPFTLALLLLSPVVHPWYLLWSLPFAALAAGGGARWGWAPIAWSLVVFVAYLPRPDYLRTGVWVEPAAARAVEYGVVWGILAAAAWRGLQLRASARRLGG